MLLGISVIAFFIVRLVPGDTVTAILGAHYSEAEAEALRGKLGLNRPLAIQYSIWLGNVVTGDLGQSAFTGEPVLSAIISRLPVTIQLVAISIGFAVLIAIPLGVMAAVGRGRSTDFMATLISMIGISVPGFWLGVLFILLFSLTLGWLPSGGFVALWEDPGANLRHMTMPGLTLGMAVAAVVTRMTRSSMLEVLDEEYIKMARAKGVPMKRLLVRHALRNSLIPVVTITGIQAGYLLGGSIIIEQVFSLPGVGMLALQAINNRDYALLQGTVLFIAVSFVIINLIVDMIYARLDPRIKYR